MEKSQNKERYIPYTMSISAIIIAVVALAVSLPRLIWTDKFGEVNLGFDYLGVIVALLALMVTLMVGWNIWQTIDAKNTVKKAEEVSERIQEFEKRIERYKNIHRPFLAYTEGVRHFDAQKYSSAVNYFLEMAELYVDYEIEFNDLMSKAIENVVTCVKKEPWNFRNRLFIDRVDKIVGRLRKLNNAITPLDAQLSRIRKELEQICEENVLNPYPIQQPQGPTNTV